MCVVVWLESSGQVDVQAAELELSAAEAVASEAVAVVASALAAFLVELPDAALPAVAAVAGD